MELIKIFSSLLTPTIAILAVYIAYQQYLIGKYKVKLDLYEKRYSCYKNVRKALMLINQKPLSPQIENFEKTNTESMFLFSKEIIEWQDTISKNAKTLQYVSEQLEFDVNKHKSNIDINKIEHNNNVNKRIELINWFTHEYLNVENRFKKYLDFKNLY